MPTNFKPIYSITPGIAKSLMIIEAAKEKVALLPVNPTVLASLRETAKLYTTHYSTMIEGNQLKLDEIFDVIQLQGHFPGRKRDEHEVKGYYAVLSQLEHYASQNHPVTEKVIQTLHTLVMSDGRTRIKPIPYRDGQKFRKRSIIHNRITRFAELLELSSQRIPDRWFCPDSTCMGMGTRRLVRRSLGEGRWL